MKPALAARSIVPCLLSTVLSLAAPAVASPQAALAAPPPVAFVHVSLVPMDSERVLADHAVVVQDGLIAALGPTAAVAVPPGAQVVDGHNQLWLLPGLIDSHIHILEPDELSLYLANGVTTVRNMSGEPMHLWWRREIKEGRMAGPTLETTSPTIDGVPPEGSNRVIVTTREEAERAVDALSADYDLFKVYGGLSAEAFAGLADAARRHGARLVGHIPRAPEFAAVLAGQASIDHAEEFLYTSFRNAGTEKIPEVVAQLHDAGTWVTPTLVTFRAIGDQIADASALAARPEQRFVDPAVGARWLSQRNRYLREFSPEVVPRFRDQMRFLQMLTGALHAGGVPLLAGTDAGIAFGVPFVLPGFSLHAELGELVACGLSPYEALRAATANPGRFMRSEPPVGTVTVGARADLLLVRGNPLEDVARARDIAGVVVRGRWLPETELDTLLEAQPKLHADEAVFVALFRKEGVAAAAQSYAEAVGRDPQARLFRESTLNGLGYELLEEDRVADAVAAFELNVRAYPGSADVHDSLGEARRAAGDVPGAVASYERALAMNPWNTNAAAMLQELREKP